MRISHCDRNWRVFELASLMVRTSRIPLLLRFSDLSNSRTENPIEGEAESVQCSRKYPFCQQKVVPSRRGWQQKTPQSKVYLRLECGLALINRHLELSGTTCSLEIGFRMVITASLSVGKGALTIIICPRIDYTTRDKISMPWYQRPKVVRN